MIIKKWRVIHGTGCFLVDYGGWETMRLGKFIRKFLYCFEDIKIRFIYSLDETPVVCLSSYEGEKIKKQLNQKVVYIQKREVGKHENQDEITKSNGTP